MTFAWPHLLWLLTLPAAWLAWELTHRRRAVAQARPKILRAEAGPRSLELAPAGATRAARCRVRAWLAAGLALALLALARPQWGRIEEPVFDQAREILLAVDLSRSMLAPDVKPSRLARAKLLIESLLEKLAGERVGLVVFSGTAFLQAPLSADYEILREFLPALGPDFLPEGGSNYGAMLEASLQAFSTTGAADRFLIVLSDGEATDEDWKGRIDELKKKGIRVLGLGVGTAGGAMLPDGTGQFVKDDRGAVVMSRLESGTLQELAKATGGVYRDASAWVDIAALVRETIEAGRKGQFVETNTVRRVERFQWPLALGLWCLLMSLCYEFPVRPRAREVALRAMSDVRSQKPEVSQAAAILLLFFLTSDFWPLTSAAHAAEAASAAPPAPSAALAKVISRLAGAAAPTARDWADLGRETVTWGGRLQTEQQTVPEGPVRDALAAATLGSRLDAKVTDWPKLREELEALLQKPEEEKKDDQDQNQPDQDQQQKQDQKQKDQKSDQQKKQKQDQKKQQQSSSEKNDPSQPQDQQENPDNKPPEQKEPGESAFGDMNKKEPPPPPPPTTQKVGGTPDRKEESSHPADPALAQPLQKLEQLRAQDSPAQLFQLMEGERKPQKKSGKNW